MKHYIKILEILKDFNKTKLPKEFFNEPKKTGLIFLWNLDPRVNVRISPRKIKKIMDMALSKTQTKLNLGRILGEKISGWACGRIYRFEKNKFIPLSFLAKLLYFIGNFSLVHPDDIIAITTDGTCKKCIINPKLPFDFRTKSGVRSLAAILHDGCITRNYIEYTKAFATTDEEAYFMRKRFLLDAKNIFGDIEPPKKGWEKTLSKKSINLPKIFADIVSLLIDIESKKRGDASIPDFIFRLSQENMCIFLRQAFDDDGSIYFKKSERNIRLRLCKKLHVATSKKKDLQSLDNAPKLLLDNLQLLRSIGFDIPNPKLIEIRPDTNTLVWQISILGQENLRKFHNYINFDLKYKSQKLEEAIDSYKQTQFRNRTAEKQFLMKAYLIQLEKSRFSARDLSLITGRTYERTCVVINKLLSRGMIKKVRTKKFIGIGGKSTLRGSKAAKYKISKKGRNLIRVVLTAGCFDIIHGGHVKTLEESKKCGDILIVVVARDSTILREKRKKPIMSEEHRREILESLKPVDKAILGYERTDKLKIVEKIKPDIIILGYDQPWDEKNLKEELKKRGLKTQILRLKGYGKISSSTIKNKIKF
jgi:FAD synthetase